MRCGTTSLVRCLDHHPEVYVATPKEIHFFDKNFHRGVPWYSRHFTGARNHRAIGEATPLYMFDERVPARMASVLPTVKLVAILRNPVDRAYSHYWQKRAYGSETLDFADAIGAEPERTGSGNETHRRLHSYLARGRYLEQLRRYCEVYPRDSLLVCLFEEFRDTPSNTLSRVCRFLGVDDLPAGNYRKSKSNAYVSFRSNRLRAFGKRLPAPLRWAIGRVNRKAASYPRMDPAVRAPLLEVFREDNAALAAWSGLDLQAWER